MPAPEITVATPAERGRVVGSLTAAFRNDPVLRYLFPTEQTYAVGAPAFFGHLFDKRVHRGTIWTIERGAATAIWEPPAADPPADGASAAGGGTDVEDHLAGQLGVVLDRVRAYDRAVHDALPATPYWYLGVLGTHPDYAGRGWGRVVMREGLRRASADGLPAVLETSNPGNVEVYRRAGWEVVRTVPEPLPIWIMRQ